MSDIKKQLQRDNKHKKEGGGLDIYIVKNVLAAGKKKKSLSHLSISTPQTHASCF